MFIVIGGIPLRHLVYRVLDLPQSMRPFVYDFGQLNTSTEYSYTFQVVANHVRKYKCLKKKLFGYFIFSYRSIDIEDCLLYRIQWLEQ